MIDRDKFFAAVREDPFGGNLSQSQVNGLNYLLDTWEAYFVDSDIRWLAYALATAYHETGATCRPIEEYGKGSGHDYGEPAGEFDQCYYGRGYVQITWLDNYQKAEQILKDTYDLEVPCVEYPHRMLEDGPAALVLFDGSINGWFTGAKLGDYFNTTKDDPYNARRVINGTDKADLIAGYHKSFLDALT